MEGAGLGAVLGGRYALRRNLTQGPDLERWSAHDTTLEREVALTIIDSDHPNRAGVVDAARRAAGVEDTRLVRILDVGTQDGHSFIVEEALGGAETLAMMLLQGPLPGEEARRIAGETAKGLETASQRGLHHLRLTPHSILIAPDGSIRVSGIAIAAAIEGPDEQTPDPATASRRDALCVVAVTYAALTSRWPLQEQVAGIEPAPRVADRVATPSEIVAGVPGDLDDLCRAALNEGVGPLTPGEFASRIAPWSRERIHRGGVEPTAVLNLSGWGDGANGGAVDTSWAEPTIAIDTREIASHRPASAQAEAPAPQAPPAQAPHVTTPVNARRPDAATTALPADVKSEANGARPVAGPTKAAGATPASAAAAAGAVGERPGAPARAAADQDPATDPESAQGAGVNPRTEQMARPKALVGHFDDEGDFDGPPLPLLPASTAQPPSRGQSKIVVSIVSAFVGLALFVGYCGTRDLGKGVSTAGSTPTHAVAAAAPPASAATSPAPRAESTAAAPIAILSATGFDPEGDQNEKNGQAARVYDNDPATTWTSEGYNTADFGSLKKGVGVLLDLGQPTSVHKADIDLGSSGPVDVTVYTATQPSLEGATLLGTASGASGKVQVKAAATLPEAQYVIVWFTKVAPDGGQFRASISEIALS